MKSKNKVRTFILSKLSAARTNPHKVLKPVMNYALIAEYTSAHENKVDIQRRDSDGFQQEVEWQATVLGALPRLRPAQS